MGVERKAKKQQHQRCWEFQRLFLKRGFLLTPQVFDEVIQLHLPLCFNAGTVHVRIEKDDGKSQDEDGVRIPKLAHQWSIAYTVALAGRNGIEVTTKKKTIQRETNNTLLSSHELYTELKTYTVTHHEKKYR